MPIERGGRPPPALQRARLGTSALPRYHERNFLYAQRFGERRRGIAGRSKKLGANHMNGLIYLIGLIVVILAILSFFGLR
jgi:hypothetical protein